IKVRLAIYFPSRIKRQENTDFLKVYHNQKKGRLIQAALLSISKILWYALSPAPGRIVLPSTTFSASIGIIRFRHGVQGLPGHREMEQCTRLRQIVLSRFKAASPHSRIGELHHSFIVDRVIDGLGIGNYRWEFAPCCPGPGIYNGGSTSYIPATEVQKCLGLV